MSWRKSLWLMAFVALAVALVAPPAGAVGNRITPQVFYPEKVDVSAPLRNMPIPPLRPLPPRERVQPGEKTIPPMAPTLDPVLQHVMGTGNMPAPFVSFDGLADADNGAVVGGYLTPADTEGAVGGNSPASNVYIQWVNLVWAVYDKTTGAQTAGPFPGNLFWSGFGGSCENSNNGDPIILYDKLADRWFVAQFAVDSSPYYECVAVSTSPDPLGTYYRYAVNTGGIFPDYPKFSVWADAYYGTVNQFNGGSGAGFMALERAKMLAGDPTAALIYFNLGAPYGNDLPVDFDGTAPGAGTPGIFAEVDKQAWIPGLTSDSLLIWYLTPDFTNPANSCLGASCTGAPNEIVPVATFTAPLCGGSRNCIPQPPGGEGLDSISDRIMYRAQGRDMVDHLSLVINHTVDAGGGIAGVRWYELRSSGGWNNWSMYQQGTYSPDSLHRWMGSIAMDHTGDIALGYSVSSSSVYTSVRYAGRLPGDPLGTLPQAEGELVAGDGVTNTGYNRWGDYSAMQVDPTDDCTFWYTQMYDRADDNTGPYPGWMWNTRIGSFKFDSCSIGPTGTLTGTVINAYTSDPVPGVLVTAGASSTLTNGSGVYTMTLPVGTYDMTASKFGFEPGSATGVPVTEGETTVQDFALTPTGNSWVDGYVTDFGHGWPLYASIAITAPPSFSTTIYTDPFTGYYSIQLDNGYNYTFTVNAVTPGYVGQSRPVSVTGADQSQNFVLSPVVPDCTVPGYVPPELPPPDVAQNFDGVTPPAIPGGWANYSFSGGANWYTNAGTHFPSGYPAATPPNLAYFNSWSVFSGNALLYMTSPVDFSTASSPELVFSLFHDTGYSGSDDNVQVMYSTDGNTFYSIGPIYHRYNGSTGWQQIALPLTSLAGQSTIYLAFYGTSYYGNDVHIDSIEVYENFAVPCGTIAGGLVAGFVTDSNTTDPLVGAMVANDIGGSTHTVATPSDPNINDGYYSMFTPIPTGNQPPGQRTFTASMAKYGSESQVINVIPSTVNRLDFALGAGWLELSPAALSSRLYPGQEQHQELDVINHGNMAADFKLLTLPITTTWPHLSPVVPMSHPKTPSTGRAPHAPNGAVTSRPLQIMLDGVPAFGEDVNNGIYGTWADTTDPGNWTTISGESGTFFAGCFLMGDFSKEYVLDYNTNTLQTVDTTTGAATVIGPASPGGGESWTGMTSTVDGTLYASGTTCGSSTLYTVDPGTGTVTPVGPITNAPCMIDISANAAGEIYGVDIVNDNLVKVDPATGAGTIIGPTGINANYAQGLAFDQVTGTLWWASFNLDTFQGEMRVIDTTTGASTLVGVMPGGAEIDAFAIPTSAGASLPWLVLDPTEGTVDAGATFPVDAHFIADGAPHFGIFRATIKASSDTPYPTNDVPVCFTKAFLDMPVGAFADKFVHGLAGARISTGCGGGNFCPNDAMTRGVMARWIELARHGADYAAPPCTGIFSDVPCESTPNADYIEAFYNEGITAGCYYNPDTGERRYCPNDPVLRQQMAVFIDVAKGWPGQDPCEQIFDDAPCASAYTPFINTLYLNGVTAGCGNNNFCGTEPNTRAQMSVFIDVAWEIPTCQ